MAHVFDSGLAAPQRTLTRAALVAALGDLLKSAGSYLADVEPITSPLSFDREADEQYFHDLVRGRSPLVLIGLGARAFDPINGGEAWHGLIDAHVYCCSSARRSHLARVEGDVASAASDQAEPGLEVVAEHVLERLAGRQLRDVVAGTVRPQREALVYLGQAYSVIEQVYQLDLVTTVNPSRDLTTLLVDLDARHTDTDPYVLRAVSEVPVP